MRRVLRRTIVIGCAVMIAATGCAFDGVNSLPLPGTVGRGSNAVIYHVELTNIGTMESNSPVMMDDVVVGSVGKMTVHGWHADVEVGVAPGVVVPANARASVGQTSLLGSMHLELNPPVGEAPTGRLQPGATIPLERSSAYPSTEQTLSSLSILVNGGGLGQVGDIIHNFSLALNGRSGAVRDLLERMDRFVGTLEQQQGDLVESMKGLDRLAGSLAGQRDVIAAVLRKTPPALQVMNKERPQLVTALNKLRVFSDTATDLVNDAGADLVKNLQNLEPTIGAFADVGPDLPATLAYAPAFPYTQNLIDRGVRGDYLNGYFIVDLTNARLRKSLLLGTHWGRLGAELVPAPGDPGHLQYQYTPDPLNPGAPGPIPPAEGAPLIPTRGPVPAPGVTLPLPPAPGAPPHAGLPGAPIVPGIGVATAPPDTDGIR